MQDTGCFILYVATIAFLSKDYELSLDICSTNFSNLANSIIFEGNILRIKSLSLTRLYEHKMK